MNDSQKYYLGMRKRINVSVTVKSIFVDQPGKLTRCHRQLTLNLFVELNRRMLISKIYRESRLISLLAKRSGEKETVSSSTATRKHNLSNISRS